MIFEYNDKIIFAGDSVTDMGSAKPVGEGTKNLGQGYVNLVKSMMSVWYPELDVRVTNSGIDGHNSRMLLDRFDRDVIDLKPDWVSICIGINDVWRQFDIPAIHEAHVSTEEYEQNVETMIEKCKAANVKGIFLATPYYMEPNKEDTMRSTMDKYGAVCKKLAEKHGCIFVDFQSAYDEFLKHYHSSYIAWDRVHPNQVGALLMAKTFLRQCGFDYSK